MKTSEKFFWEFFKTKQQKIVIISIKLFKKHKIQTNEKHFMKNLHGNSLKTLKIQTNKTYETETYFMKKIKLMMNFHKNSSKILQI